MIPSILNSGSLSEGDIQRRMRAAAKILAVGAIRAAARNINRIDDEAVSGSPEGEQPNGNGEVGTPA